MFKKQGGDDLEQLNSVAIQAKTDQKLFNELIESQKWFLLRCCHDVCGRYISESDDEYSIAMFAFSKAVENYDDSKGEFLAFARVVTRNQLYDYLRSQSRLREVSVSPYVFESRNQEDFSPLEKSVQTVMNQQALFESQTTAAEEIEAANQVFSEFGFSFYDLAACSPKSKKTKNACRMAVQYLLSNAKLAEDLFADKFLPLQKIEKNCGLPRKLLERHRKYIIAAVVLLSGEYPHLSQYLSAMKKEERP